MNGVDRYPARLRNFPQRLPSLPQFDMQLPPLLPIQLPPLKVESDGMCPLLAVVQAASGDRRRLDSQLAAGPEAVRTVENFAGLIRAS